jgi:hypothetical protein
MKQYKVLKDILTLKVGQIIDEKGGHKYPAEYFEEIGDTLIEVIKQFWWKRDIQDLDIDTTLIRMGEAIQQKLFEDLEDLLSEHSTGFISSCLEKRLKQKGWLKNG